MHGGKRVGGGRKSGSWASRQQIAKDLNKLRKPKKVSEAELEFDEHAGIRGTWLKDGVWKCNCPAGDTIPKKNHKLSKTYRCSTCQYIHPLKHRLYDVYTNS